MSEEIKEAEVNETEKIEKVEAEEVKPKKRIRVNGGKAVFEDDRPRKKGLGYYIKKGLWKVGCAIKEHPIATALILGGSGAAGIGMKKAYESGFRAGHDAGEEATLKRIESEREEEEELKRLEQESQVPVLEESEEEIDENELEKEV